MLAAERDARLRREHVNTSRNRCGRTSPFGARSDCPAPRDGVISPKHHHRTDDCNDHAPDIEAGYPRRAKKAEYDAAHDRADNTERDVEQHAFARLVDDLTSDK